MAAIWESTPIGRAIARSRKLIEVVPIEYDGTIGQCMMECRLLKVSKHVHMIVTEPPAIDIWGGRSKDPDSMEWRLRVTCKRT